MKKLQLWITLAVAGLGFAANVHAADQNTPYIILKVPLVLKNLSPEVTRARIICHLYGAESDSQIGGKFVQVGITKDDAGVGHVDRPASNPVLVKVRTFDSGYQPKDAKRYRCFLRLEGPGKVVPPRIAGKVSRRTPIWAQADPRQPFNAVVEGPLPWLQQRQ